MDSKKSWPKSWHALLKKFKKKTCRTFFLSAAHCELGHDALGMACVPGLSLGKKRHGMAQNMAYSGYDMTQARARMSLPLMVGLLDISN